MILTAHILVGAVIAEKTQNPILGLSFALLSHYFLDATPHQDYYINNILGRRWASSSADFIKLFLDIFLGFSLIMIFSKNYSLAILGGLSAALPDVLIFISAVFPRIKLFSLLNRLHRKTHWFRDAKLNKKVPLFWGISTQILISLAAISIFLR